MPDTASDYKCLTRNMFFDYKFRQVSITTFVFGEKDEGHAPSRQWKNCKWPPCFGVAMVIQWVGHLLLPTYHPIKFCDFLLNFSSLNIHFGLFFNFYMNWLHFTKKEYFTIAKLSKSHEILYFCTFNQNMGYNKEILLSLLFSMFWSYC